MEDDDFSGKADFDDDLGSGELDGLSDEELIPADEIDADADADADDIDEVDEADEDDDTDEAGSDVDELDEDNPDLSVVDISRESSCFITKFELARVIGLRMRQLIRGAPPLIPVPKGTINIEDLAQKEFEAGVLPIVITRPYPTGRRVKISASKMINIMTN